jgi:hypothetical protein
MATGVGLLFTTAWPPVVQEIASKTPITKALLIGQKQPLARYPGWFDTLMKAVPEYR